MPTDQSLYQGVIVSTPTFCDDNYQLELERQREHFRRLIDAGVVEGKGVILAAGGIGEGYMLNDEEWSSLVDLVAEETKGKVPSQVGLYEISSRQAAKKAKYAANAGIDFLQVTPPHYLPPTDDEIFEFYQYINDRAEIGIVAYNIPWAMPDAHEFSLPFAERLAELENVVGIKWFSYNDRNFYEVLSGLSGRLNIASNQGAKLSQGFRMGMKAFLDLWANFSPKLSLELWELLEKGKYDEYDKQYLKYHFPFECVITKWGRKGLTTVGEGTIGKGIYSALGLDCGPPFPPQKELPDEFKEDIRDVVESTGIKKWFIDLGD